MLQAPPVNLVISSGEPAGIGPEISLAATLAFLKEQPTAYITVLADTSVLQIPKEVQSDVLARLKLEPVALAKPVTTGKLNPANAQYVLKLLDTAVEGCLAGRFDAMITAPLQKSVMNVAGTPFTGHTEYLAQACKINHVVMMLCAALPLGFLGLKRMRALRVALATTHLPLRDVPAALTHDHVLETIQIVHRDLEQRFGIPSPVIRVAGLNPHAGESGYLGREEIEAISPAIELAKQQSIQVTGPYPGDTMMDASSLDHVDAYIAMFHDQGLAPFKFATFGGGVNVTLGLPIIRTSVDHGTALDIAGKGIADPSSMLEALRLAHQLAVNQKVSNS